jgi:hypothetical protein
MLSNPWVASTAYLYLLGVYMAFTIYKAIDALHGDRPTLVTYLFAALWPITSLISLLVASFSHKEE